MPSFVRIDYRLDQCIEKRNATFVVIGEVIGLIIGKSWLVRLLLRRNMNLASEFIGIAWS